MAVVADIDGLDLWVEPHEWTDEQRDEVKRFIQESRTRETDPAFSKKAAEVLAKVRASSALSPDCRAEGVAPGRSKIEG